MSIMLANFLILIMGGEKNGTRAYSKNQEVCKHYAHFADNRIFKFLSKINWFFREKVEIG
jgi:hypothetical protein